MADERDAESQHQKDWIALATEVRHRLERLGREAMPSYKPEEIKWYVDACQAAYWLEIHARKFDNRMGRFCTD